MEAGKTRGVLAACLAVVFLVFFFEYLVAGVAGAPREAYVTFVASDEYAVGARALGASLRATGSPSLSISPLSLLTPPLLFPFSFFGKRNEERARGGCAAEGVGRYAREDAERWVAADRHSTLPQSV